MLFHVQSSQLNDKLFERAEVLSFMVFTEPGAHIIQYMLDNYSLSYFHAGPRGLHTEYPFPPCALLFVVTALQLAPGIGISSVFPAVPFWENSSLPALRSASLRAPGGVAANWAPGRGVGSVRGPAFLPAQRVGLRAGAGSRRADPLSSLQSLRWPPGTSAELRLQELARGANSVELA